MKDKYWDYFILVARFLIGCTFLSYGYGKLMDGQFGLVEADLSAPVKEVGLFKLSWYLFDHQPFKASIGISQVICGALLIINRTAILGAFIFLPIVATILIIDLSFMPDNMANAFAWRLSFYILLDFLILGHYKEKMRLIWSAVWQNVTTKYSIPIWGYAILPIMAVALEVMGVLPRLVGKLILHPQESWQGFEELTAIPVPSIRDWAVCRMRNMSDTGDSGLFEPGKSLRSARSR